MRRAPIASEQHTDPLTTAGWYLAVALTSWAFGYTIMRGSDLFWHIAGGRWMVEQGSLWVRDPYSYTSHGQYWLNDAWLSDVLLYLWVEAFGLASLAYWKWILIVATGLVLFRLLLRLTRDPLSSYIAVAFGMAVAAPFLDVRPQLYSFLCFALLLEGTLGRPQPKWWLPLLYLVWVNLHAGFLLGLLVLPLLFAVPLYRNRQRRPVLLLAGLCVLACLANPHGVEVVLRPLRYALDPSSPFRRLGEWLPPFEPGGIRSWLYPYAIAAFGVAAVVVAASGGKKRSLDDWAMIAVGALVLAMSLRSRRFVPFFAYGQCLVTALALARLTAGIELPRRWLPVPAVALALFWLWPYPRQAAAAFHYLVAEYEFPVESLSFIEANDLSGDVFAYYNWGGYIHFRSNGRMRVFIDGRSETIYSDETFNRYLLVLSARDGFVDVIERSGADFVLWPLRSQQVARGLVATGRWRLIHQDQSALLLARASVDLPSPLRSTPETAFQQVSLGYRALVAGEYALAQGFYRRALELMPYFQTACVQLAQAQIGAGDLESARATSERCGGLYPDPNRDRFLDRVLERAGAGRAS